MSVQLEIPFDALTELVKQLSSEEKLYLLQTIKADIEDRPLSVEEKIRILHSAVSPVPMTGDFPVRREDMYNDDDR